MKHRGHVMGLVGLVLACVWVGTAAAEDLSSSAVINKAGRQRMLSQRLVKDYCQIGLNVRRDEARSQLDEGLRLFESQLAELARYAPDRETRIALAEVEEAWAPVRIILTRPYDKNEVKKLVDLSEELLTRTQRVVVLIQDASHQPFLRLVNISGRQRMLSQRIAKLYMCRQAGVRDAGTLEALEQVKNEFRGALADLMASPKNTAGVNQALDAARVQWELLEYSLKHSDKPLEEFVAITSERILGIMEGVTASYEQMGG